MAHFSGFRPSNSKVIGQFFLLLYLEFNEINTFHFKEIGGRDHFWPIMRLTVKPFVDSYPNLIVLLWHFSFIIFYFRSWRAVKNGVLCKTRVVSLCSSHLAMYHRGKPTKTEMWPKLFTGNSRCHENLARYVRRSCSTFITRIYIWRWKDFSYFSPPFIEIPQT